MSEPGVTRPGEGAAVTAAARPLGGRTKAGHMERAAENFVRPIVERAYESIAAAVRAEERERNHIPTIAPQHGGRWGVFCAACSTTAGDYVFPCRAHPDYWREQQYPARLAREEPTEWRPGDPCAACGSRETFIDDDRSPRCGACGRADSDE